MKLTEQEADLFFDLMWKLQWYTNQEYQVISPVETPDDYKNLVDMEEKMQVRNTLFDKFPEIAKSFAKTNPFQLNPEELQIIQQWEKHIKGAFFIERFLKRYTVFIERDTEVVYGVFGLYEPLSDIIDKSNLPVCIEAILLPFKDKIIYDGLLQGYPIFFGSGITSELKEIYLTAKQNQAIVTSFNDNQPTKVKVLKSIKDWQPEIKELVEKAKKLRGGAGQPPVYSPIFSLLKLSLDLADKATSDDLDLDYFYKKTERLDSLIHQIENQLHRMGK